SAGLPGPERAKALPVPVNHGFGTNEMKRLSPPSPMVGEPYPEETIEAPESRSLRTATEQGKLLPKRQILERELAAGSERRAQDAQQSECEVHCSPWLARRLPIVQSRGRVLAKDKAVLFGFALFAGSEAALARGGRAGGGGSEHGRPYRDVRRQPGRRQGEGALPRAARCAVATGARIRAGALRRQGRV